MDLAAAVSVFFTRAFVSYIIPNLSVGEARTANEGMMRWLVL
jgi:hypothetical protein